MSVRVEPMQIHLPLPHSTCLTLQHPDLGSTPGVHQTPRDGCPNEFEKKLDVAITNQDVETLRLLSLRQNEFNIDREFVGLYEDDPCQPLLYRHLRRHRWPVIPSPKITHMLILAGADVNYHLINDRCNALRDALL